MMVYKQRIYIKLLILELLAMFATSNLLGNAQFQFEYLNSSNGLSHNTVFSIIQDKEGYMWIATREGLNRFDGTQVTTYYKENHPGLQSNKIHSLFLSSTGNLFIGHEKGVSFYDKYLNTFHPILYNDENIGAFPAFAEASEGNSFTFSPKGLFVINKDLHVQKVNSMRYFDIREYRSGVYWGVQSDQIVLINDDGEMIKAYNNESTNSSDFDFSLSNITQLYTDSKGVTWVGTMRSGLGYYFSEKDEFRLVQFSQNQNPIEANFIRAICEDQTGNLWIGTESGLYIYNPDKNETRFIGQGFNERNMNLNDKAIYTIYRSNENIMWLGTYFGGVNYALSFAKGFRNIYADVGIKSLAGNALSQIIEVSPGTFWIATEDGGITIYNSKNNSFRYITTENTPGLKSNNVHALEMDPSGDIWIGTFLGGLHRYNSRTKTIQHIPLIHPNKGIAQMVYSIFIDSQKRIWVGAISGLYMKAPNATTFTLYAPETFQGNHVYDIYEDHTGRTWICTRHQGIYTIGTDARITNYRMNITEGIASDNIISIHQDSRKDIWFGTIEGGLVKYTYSSGTFRSFLQNNGLPNNTVYAIIEDQTGSLWLSTNRGISKFDPITEKTINYLEVDGIVNNQFNFKSGLLASDGMVLLGSVNGLTSFYPDKIQENRNRPILHLADFKLFNKSLPIGTENILPCHINYANSITLKNKLKVFTIDYLAIDYLSMGDITFAYYLEGFEEDWNYVGDQTNATYTNLYPGRYTFHLKAANSDGIWSNTTKTLQIHILPPIWLSVYGYTFYALLLLTGLILYRRYTIMRHKEKLNIELANIEKRNVEDLNQHRLKFFTYISHEFKTPLTLIIATLDHMLYFDDISPKFAKFGNSIRKNAMRLLFLINQLMDFRKIETDHASIRYNKGDIVQFLKSTFEIFYPLFAKKDIEARFKCDYESFICYFDPDKIEKIVTNILSNSYKNIHHDGIITLEAQIHHSQKGIMGSSNKNAQKKELYIRIADNGPGLPKDKIQQIFEPFYSETKSNISSSGIGLALVKSMVKYLNGTLTVESDGRQGINFCIHLPIIEQIENTAEINNEFIEKNLNFSLENTIYDDDIDFNSETVIVQQPNESTHELLIVEDNKELLSFLSYHFSKYFKVKTAKNGIEALKKIALSHPDLIISDIMMPKLDGIELCKRLKDSFETSHIPIILLTAKSGEESKMEGLDFGADAYISKPFNIKELGLHVRNILKSRETLKKHLVKFGALNETVDTLNNKDQKFIEQLTSIIFKNLDNTQFDVDTFAREASVSRTLLHNKLKKITGLSTTEFIKTIKLNEAKKLLIQKEFTVSEIAYKVGFNDPAYFSRSFKSLFKVSPSEIDKLNPM